MTDDGGRKAQASRWEKIDDIVSFALQTPIKRRSAFIKAACGKDEELRREVESLLKHVEPSAQLFSDLSAVLSGHSSQIDQAIDDPMIGQTIQRYRIKERYPSGMACVYRAWDLATEKSVVLKMTPRGLDEGMAREAALRMRRESHADVVLRHPSVCEILGTGETTDGRPFLVMEFCEGRTLRAILGGQAIDLPDLLSVGIQLADALAAAHELGLTHRDVKPANVMIDGSANVKLLDFGIAKLEGHNLTKTGRVLGTLEYMSPEQVSGLPVTSSSDIFSLGAVLFEAGTGTHPFRRSRKRETVSAILGARLNESSASERFPAALESLVRTMLSKEPAERPSAVEVTAALKALRASR